VLIAAVQSNYLLSQGIVELGDGFVVIIAGKLLGKHVRKILHTHHNTVIKVKENDFRGDWFYIRLNRHNNGICYAM